ncbi:MAG: hypothetical protein ABIG68_08265 [Acidobacteriota bacterium]
MANDRNQPGDIRGYLLGDLTHETQEELERKLMTDDDFHQQILMAEDDLVDEYLSGQLAASQRQRFEEHFLRSPERQQKLRFARALHEYLNMVAQERGVLSLERQPVPSVGIGLRHSILRFFARPARGLVPALAAAVLVLAVTAPWYLLRMKQLRGEVSELRAELSQIRSQVATPGEIPSGTQPQIRTQESTALAGIDTPGKPRSLMPSAPLPVALILHSGGRLRSASGGLQLLEIEDQVSLVDLKLDMAAADYPSYRASLLVEGEEVMSQAGFRAEETSTAIMITWRMAAAVFTSGDYEVRLQGITSDGRTEDADTYFFRVRKP